MNEPSMQSSEDIRHQAIENRVSQHPAAVDEASVELWELVAVRLTVLIGEGGFFPLYSRSVYLTRQRFLWLAPSTLSIKQTDRQQPFGSLKDSLYAQLQLESNGEALAGSTALFITFFDLLAGLIGEALTLNLLQAAWNNDVPEKADKEI